MANAKYRIKRGMKGSNNGKSRWAGTEELKEASKGPRRKQGEQERREQLEDFIAEEEERGK